MKPKVYLTNFGNHTYTDAERFGALTPITKGRINIWSSDNMIQAVKEGLKDATPQDFLIMSGYLVIGGYALHVLLKKFGKVNALVWDGSSSHYKLVTYLDIEV